MTVCGLTICSRLCGNRENQTFAATRPSSVLLEQVAVCVAKSEPVLLVGETGTGKTSTVQHLAGVTGELHSLRLYLHRLLSIFFPISPPSAVFFRAPAACGEHEPAE